jgi:hypothetical protein
MALVHLRLFTCADAKTFAVVCYLRDTFPAFSSKRRFKKLPRQMLEPLLE